jgi:hypothetical protein
VNDIEETQQRTRSYWFIDGIAEIVGGAALMIVGALLYAAYALRNDAVGTIALVVMVLAFPASAALIRRAKDRLTHPLTGFVDYPDPSGKRRGIAAAVGAAVAGLLVVIAAKTGETGGGSALPNVALVVAAAAVAGALAWRAWRAGMPRFYVSAGAVLLAGVYAGWAGLGFTGGIGVMWLVLGAVSICTGATALADYVQGNMPPPKKEEAEPKS